MRKFTRVLLFFIVVLLINTSAKAGVLDTVKIVVEQDSIDFLDDNAYADIPVQGSFIDGKGSVCDTVNLKYRGAYSLLNLLNSGAIQRNWKVKFPKEKKYRNRREWNFNYEPAVNQVLAYTVLKNAGIKVPSARHVNMYVNDVRHGLYIEYEDPDNSDWLKEMFGSNNGDLYKAATDLPDQTKYFATLEVLGNNSSDYFNHYQKKTNNDDAQEFDYSSIIEFTKLINNTPDSLFISTLNANFDTESFIKFLVIGNFISFWDGYPQRPKNFWLYRRPINNKWYFIPWDLNDTFLESNWLSRYKTTSSIFLFFDSSHGPSDWGFLQTGENKNRPLVTRMMKFDYYRNAYVAEYKKAINTYLAKSKLTSQVDSITTAANGSIPSSEYSQLASNASSVKNYISKRYSSVSKELLGITIPDAIPVFASNSNIVTLDVYPNPVSEKAWLKVNMTKSGIAKVVIYNLQGQLVLELPEQDLLKGENELTVNASLLSNGVYLCKLKVDNTIVIKKLIKR
jgi:spore coat protein CotH